MEVARAVIELSFALVGVAVLGGSMGKLIIPNYEWPFTLEFAGMTRSGGDSIGQSGFSRRPIHKAPVGPPAKKPKPTGPVAGMFDRDKPDVITTPEVKPRLGATRPKF